MAMRIGQSDQRRPLVPLSSLSMSYKSFQGPSEKQDCSLSLQKMTLLLCHLAALRKGMHSLAELMTHGLNWSIYILFKQIPAERVTSQSDKQWSPEAEMAVLKIQDMSR